MDLLFLVFPDVTAINVKLFFRVWTPLSFVYFSFDIGQVIMVWKHELCHTEGLILTPSAVNTHHVGKYHCTYSWPPVFTGLDLTKQGKLLLFQEKQIS